MKALKITYWISTSLIAAMMSFSTYAYLTQEEIKQGFHQMGFPDFFRVELGIAKLIGAIVLILPLPARLKEWAYAGFMITFISAFIAHTTLGHPTDKVMGPVIAFTVLMVSYYTYLKTQKTIVTA